MGIKLLVIGSLLIGWFAVPDTAPLGTYTQRERSHRRLLRHHHAVKAVIRFGERGEFSRVLPIESPTVYQYTANDYAMAG